MTGEAIAKFQELRGWKVVQAAGSFWQEFRPRCYMSLPYNTVIKPDPDEVAALLRTRNALCVRYPAIQQHGLEGGLYVLRDKKFSLTSVHSKQRSRVRRGLERCEIQPLDLDLLLREGLQLNLDTMARQHRFEPEFGELARWKRFVDALRVSPAASAIGAFVDGRLSGYTIHFLEDRWLHVLYKMSRIADLEHCANHALQFHSMSQIAESNVDAVCGGPLSVAVNEGLHEFKTRMGMEVEPQKLAVRLHPAVSRILTSSAAITAVQQIRRFRPQSRQVNIIAEVLRGARLSNERASGTEQVAPC